ncbi:CobW family GTP-binding protein [Oceanibacterium hippocampi]|uniref:Putative GTP-binding protein YjiA n=1 Tax=Oceanibacterium hippocampi TaxID=745714 RepID=A0A1Y5R931_9PROT|nr:GTP-binding protein [Oceanibacterium hippocampi]SLN12008.1 putative GTP-binding protein YjiA [Oceanibacterium hippocampi]
MIDRPPVPVTVLTGFLGSGKSTVIGRLLRDPALARTAVIVNEYGEVPIDHALVRAAEENLVTLNSGCLCCTLRGDLVETLGDLIARRAKAEIPDFNRVLVETTGLADPAPILHTLMSEPLLVRHFRLDGIVTTIDAVHGLSQIERHPEAVKQAAVADRLLLTKGDLVDAARLAALTARLGDLNPAARPIRVDHGDVAAAAILDAGLFDPARKTADVRGWLREEAYAATSADGHAHHHDHGAGPAHDGNHGDAVDSFCLFFDAPLEWDDVAAWLDLLASLRGDGLLRMKGILDIRGEERPVVIHGVQHLFHPPALLDAWPDDDRRSRIVFITRDLDRAVVTQTLAAIRGGG